MFTYSKKSSAENLTVKKSAYEIVIINVTGHSLNGINNPSTLVLKALLI